MCYAFKGGKVEIHECDALIIVSYSMQQNFPRIFECLILTNSQCGSIFFGGIGVDKGSL